MASKARRSRAKKVKGNFRYSAFTGGPGVPLWMRERKRRVNSNDHSATNSKRAMWYEVGGVKTQMKAGYIHIP